MRITYTARRRIASGHTAGNSYDLDLYAARLVPNFNTQRAVNRGNEGDQEVSFFYSDEEWAIQTDHMDASTRDIFMEFFASHLAGEYFTFDPDRNPGDVADVDPREAVLVSVSPGLTRVDPNLNVWQAAFTIRNVAPIT